jgi:hypothetical protein
MARKKAFSPADISEPLKTSFPIYFLLLGKRLRVVFPEGREDIGHCDFWEQTVASVVANFYRIPLPKLLNLPYCQRRARVYGANVYYGERPAPVLLRAARKALADDTLVFAYDDHEKRLRAEVLAFRRLVGRR